MHLLSVVVNRLILLLVKRGDSWLSWLLCLKCLICLVRLAIGCSIWCDN